MSENDLKIIRRNLTENNQIEQEIRYHNNQIDACLSKIQDNLKQILELIEDQLWTTQIMFMAVQNEKKNI